MMASQGNTDLEQLKYLQTMKKAVQRYMSLDLNNKWN